MIEERPMRNFLSIFYRKNIIMCKMMKYIYRKKAKRQQKMDWMSADDYSPEIGLTNEKNSCLMTLDNSFTG